MTANTAILMLMTTLVIAACGGSGDEAMPPQPEAGPSMEQCAPGFSPVGEVGCEDIDECALGQCPSGVVCENLEGSYNCPCEGDFHVDQFNTERDIEEVRGCTAISGDFNVSGTELTSLDFLQGLRSVAGNLWIGGHEGSGRFDASNASLANLGALSGLTQVGGDFWIYDSPALGSLDGLHALTHVGGMLQIEDCDALSSLEGLHAVSSVGSLDISKNDALTSLGALSSLTVIDGTLQIWSNDSLPNLEGLQGVEHIDGRLRISLNYALTSVSGLGSVRSVGSHFEMVGNNRLMSLEGFSSLASVEYDFKIKDHPNLPSCEAERLRDQVGIDNIGGEVTLEDNTGSGTCG